MIFVQVQSMNGSGETTMYLSLNVTLGSTNTAADCYIDPNDSIMDQHTMIADAARAALRMLSLDIAVDAPVRMFGGIMEIG